MEEETSVNNKRSQCVDFYALRVKGSEGTSNRNWYTRSEMDSVQPYFFILVSWRPTTTLLSGNLKEEGRKDLVTNGRSSYLRREREFVVHASAGGQTGRGRWSTIRPPTGVSVKLWRSYREDFGLRISIRLEEVTIEEPVGFGWISNH